MSAPLNEREVIEWLRAQTDKRFAEIFYKATAGRVLAPLPDFDTESHLVLTHVYKHSDAPLDWEIEFIGLPADPKEWADDAVFAQEGEHCAQTVLSFAKRFACPLCGEEAYGS